MKLKRESGEMRYSHRFADHKSEPPLPNLSRAQGGRCIRYRAKLGSEWQLDDHDSKPVAAASGKGEVLIWDVQTGERKHIIQAHKWRALDVAFSLDGDSLISVSHGNNVCYFNAKSSARQRKRYLNIVDPASHATFSPNRKFVALISTIDSPMPLPSIFRRAALLTEYRRVEVCHLSTAKVCYKIDTKDGLRCSAFSPNGKLLASTHASTIKLWDAATGSEHSVLQGLKEPYSVAFSPKGEYVVSGSENGKIMIWNTKTGEPKPCSM